MIFYDIIYILFFYVFFFVIFTNMRCNYLFYVNSFEAEMYLISQTIAIIVVYNKSVLFFSFSSWTFHQLTFFYFALKYTKWGDVNREENGWFSFKGLQCMYDQIYGDFFFSFQMQGMYRLFDRKGGIFFEREEIK